MKKFLSIIFAVAILVPCMFFMTACGKDDGSEKVMNVDLNPKLEFVLDKNDKVVTVNALNDDGNHILSLEVDSESVVEAFEGMTAQEAMDLFLELTKENGYLITGNEDKVNISISGDANDLLNSVKSTANKFFTDNGLTGITIHTAKINKDALKEEVKKCMQEYTDTQLNNMSEEKLIELLKESRMETKEFLTQELKEAYYDLRLEEMNMAKLNELYNQLKNLAVTGDQTIADFLLDFEDLKAQLTALHNAYVTNILENADYQAAMTAYVEAKEALLEKRLELSADGEITATEYTDELASLESAVADAKADLEDVYDDAMAIIDGVRETLQDTLSELQGLINTIVGIIDNLPLPGMDINMEDLNNAHNEAKENFMNKFKTSEQFENFKNKSNWDNMELTPPPAV